MGRNSAEGREKHRGFLVKSVVSAGVISSITRGHFKMNVFVELMPSQAEENDLYRNGTLYLCTATQLFPGICVVIR